MPIQPPDEKNSETFESVGIWGECGEFSMPGSVWLTMLDVAHLYGWKGAGTNPPDAEYADCFFDGPTHDGDYCPPRQRVSQKDAKHLAQALQRALLDIPDGTTELEAGSFVRWDESLPASWSGWAP